MQFRAEEYYKASLERIAQAERIHKHEGSQALAMYCGGLAVECLLRAFRWSADEAFEGRHDLRELLKASGLLRIDEDFMRRTGQGPEDIRATGHKLFAAMNEVVVLWHNNLRFASEGSLRAFLRRIGRLQGVKGDPLKKNASDLLEAARTVIDRGIALWTSKKRS